MKMAAFIWGFGKSGQLGNGRTDTVHTPVQLQLKFGAEQIDCGGHYTMVITTKGNLLAFGCAKYGRLGTGDETDRLQPELIKCTGSDGRSVQFKKISCGIWHGAAISESHDIYIWGFGRSHGVLGSSDITHMSPPTILNGPFNSKVSGVSCGNNYTLMWTTEGAAYSWGCGRHGVLGHGRETDKASPTVISKFKDGGVAVIFMNAGFTHCGAVTADGQVYMFGRGEDGALGLGKEHLKTVTVPAVVESLTGKEICELSCSLGEKHGHTLFVSKSGQVYSCGDGYKGKLGLGDQTSRFDPTLIPEVSFNGGSIAHVAAGGIHSAAVSKEGHVFTWGCGSDGRLGHPEGKGHRYLFRSDVPKIVEGLVKEGPASAVCCSYYHTAAVLRNRVSDLSKALGNDENVQEGTRPNEYNTSSGT